MAFSVDKTDGDELTFFIIDTGNGYSSDSYKGRVEVGRLVSDENTLFVTARDHYRINAYPEKFPMPRLRFGRPMRATSEQ